MPTTTKAWVAAAVSFAAITAASFFGLDISPEFQAAAVAVITGVMTWLVPNGTAA